MEKKIHYYESQRFTQKWLWVLLGAICLLCIYALASSWQEQFMEGELFEKLIWGFTLMLPFLVMILLYSMHLEIQILDTGIQYRFSPFYRSFNFLPFDDIKLIQVKKYRPIMDYMGWGIRINFKSIAYTTKGDNGIWIEKQNGKCILLGTQNPQKVKQIIDLVYNHEV